MNVCVIIFPKDRDTRLQQVAASLAQGIGTNGHTVDVIDGVREQGKKISYYDYIAMGTDAVNTFGGRIPSSVQSFLSQCGAVQGKRCFAFVSRGGVRKNKTLKALMDAMEHEGMYLKNSQIVSSGAEAGEIGKRLHIG